MRCARCGSQIVRSIAGEYCSKKCFSESFWEDALDNEAIIIDGVCYHDGGMKPKGYMGFLGFGGRLFKIKMNDGKVIETNDLWCQGTIPVELNVEDNATFMRERSFK